MDRRTSTVIAGLVLVSCSTSSVDRQVPSDDASAPEPPPAVTGPSPTDAGTDASDAAAPSGGRIEGTVFVQTSARGRVVLFLYDETRPPPPRGTGMSVARTIVSAEDLFGAALANDELGQFAAPFVFEGIAPGRYTVQGFVDVDTCRARPEPCHVPDYDPRFGVTREPSSGDLLGAALDLPTGALRVVEVAATDDAGPKTTSGVVVAFTDDARVVHDRPAFLVESERLFDPSKGPKVIVLTPAPIQAAPVDQRPKGFAVRFVDENEDDVPDDANGDSVPDVWPLVRVRKLDAAQSSLADENDADGDGAVDATGTDYTRLDGTKDGLPDVVELHASIVVDDVLPSLYDEQGAPRMEHEVVVSSLRIALAPRAFDLRDRANPVALQSVPSGRYSVTLVYPTGQTWRVPNELDPAHAPAKSLPSVASQSFVIEVP